MIEISQQVLLSSRVRVGFSKAKGLAGVLSRLICWGTKGRASHAWIVYRSLDFPGMDMVMEAHATGVRCVSLEFFAAKNEVVRIIDPMFMLDAGLPVGGRELGWSFAFQGLAGAGWVVIAARWLHKAVKNPFLSAKAAFCSMLVEQVMLGAKYPHLTEADPETSNPEKLWELLLDHGGRVEL